MVLRIQFPLLVWIASTLSSPSINYWDKYLFVPILNFVDVIMLFLAFVAVFMVSLQGKSNYLVGLCLVMLYMVYLLINWYT
jgi:Ca2+/H+ antiporter